MSLDILLPIYNEEAILADNAKLLLAYAERHLADDWMITLIINGSSDQSLAIAESLAQSSPRFKIISLKEGGKGRALKAGLATTTADIAVYMDIDLAVSLEALLPLIEAISRQNADLAIGSRLLPQAQTERSWLREGSSRAYNRLAGALLGCKISDLQCGFKAIRQSAIKPILAKIKDDAWFFDTELIFWANQLGFRLAEIPVSWSENRYAKRQSKIKLSRDPFIFLKKLFKLRSHLKKL